MRSLPFLLIAGFVLVLMAGEAKAANEERSDTDTAYLMEKWRAGFGTEVGALNTIKSADIDNDGEDELIFGNSQGYVHILDWNSSANAFSEEFQSIDLGGPVRGIEIGQIDNDPQLEIVVGYNWVSDVGKVKIIDGITLQAEANWSSGVSWSDSSGTEGWPYGLAIGDLDGDGETELGMGGDRGYLWVVDAETPEIYVGRDVTSDEAEWYVDVGDKIDQGSLENTWGLTFGQFDEDDAMEVAIGSKEGWIAIFDGETEELQWKFDMDGSDNTDSFCYRLISTNLNGNDIDELVVSQQDKLTIFVDGDKDTRIDNTDIVKGYGLAHADLFGDENEELIVADDSGNISIMSLSDSGLTTHQEWNGGYPMNAGAGVTLSMNGHDNPWIIHGGDAGVIVAWEITSASGHSMIWKSESGSNGGQTLYSLEGAMNYGVAMGNIDDDDNLEILVGSGSGKVYAFDGKTYELDWVSPILDKLPMGIAVADLNNDGDNEIVVTTGMPGEAKNNEGDGGEGYLYIFERSGDTFIEAFQSSNIDAALGVVIAELDGSTYSEIGIATGYLEIIDETAGTTELHGKVKIWGYDGSSYSEEWSSGDLGQIVGGIDSGDPDGDGDNELVVGTGGDDREGEQDTAEVRVYHHTGNTYSLDGSVIDSERYYAFGIDVSDVDNDGEEEIIVGTGAFGDSKPKLAVYDGDSHSVEYSKSVDSSSVWGVKTGDFDSDGFAELIYGTSGGEIFIYDGETEDFEAKTSALSGNAGHYGGIAIGNVDNDGDMEMVVGSEAYMWLFTIDVTNQPDLAIDGHEITFSPSNPNEDEDILINVTVHNYGDVEAPEWRVKLYDGDPDNGGSKITEYNSNEEESIPSGENFTFQRTWYAQQTSPGYHDIYVVVEDTQQPRQETKFDNNKDFTTIHIEDLVLSIDGIDYETNLFEGQNMEFEVILSNLGDEEWNIDWDMGDGVVFENSESVMHRYPDNGLYEITITADDGTYTTTKVFEIEVSNVAPYIDDVMFGNFGYEGETISFNAQTSDVSDDTVTVTWSFPDGSMIEGDFVQYKFTDDGEFGVVVTASDEDGGDSSEQILVTVENVAPIFTEFVMPSNGQKGEALDFNVGASDPGDDTITYSFDFGDGTSSLITPDGGNITHKFTDSGSFTIVICVKDEDGGETCREQVLPVISVEFPVALANDIDWNDEAPKNKVKPGDEVIFKGGGNDEDGEIVLYEWDFNGDGEFDWSSEKTGSTTFVYNNEGTYTAVLRVTDNDGFTATDERTITVSEEKDDEDDDGGEDEGNVTVTDAEKDESSVPSISLISSIAAMGIIALRRRY